MNMKNKLFLATAIIALAACSDNTYLGDENGANGSGGAISFEMSTPSLTRSDETTANKLGKNFVLYGYKNTSDLVFNNYQVNWKASTAGTTQSNSANWEYVGYKNLPNGVLTNAGVTEFSTTTTGDPNNSTAIDQTIKYWDVSANYTFFAYSLGEGFTSGEPSSTTWAKSSTMTNSGYSLTGTREQLGTCYISKKKTVVPNNGNNKETAVQLEFLNFLSQIELGFYETIPGYSIKNIKFYASSAEGTSGTTPYLYSSSNNIANGGTYNITFDAAGNPLVEFTTTSPTYTNNVAFSTAMTNYADPEHNEAAISGEDDKGYLGRASNAATMTNKVGVLPMSTGVALNVRIDFTLVSTDGSGEVISITDNKATIPAAYTAWKPNYKYTYLFKISDSTGELYPITLDATIVTTETGQQTTITTVDEPSITTYAKGAIDNEYKKNSNIYVVVDKGGAVQTLTVGTNAKLYRVTNDTGSGSTQEITEQSVANALAHGTPSDGSEPTDGTDDTWTVTGVGMKSLIVTSLNVPTLTATSSIPAADSPTGVAINLDGTNNKCAWFTPTAAGTYAFEYSEPEVGTPCIAATGKYVAGTTYYTDATGETTVDTTSFEDGVTDVSSYFVTNPSYKPALKAYKVIKVVD